MDDLKRQYDIQPLKQADMSILVNGQAVNAAQGRHKRRACQTVVKPGMQVETGINRVASQELVL